MRRRMREGLGALLRWLLMTPAILLILLGCGQAGIASADIPESADTRSRVRVDYSPWPVAVVKPLNPGVYEVIQADVGDEMTLASPAPGEFWSTATPTATAKVLNSTPSVTSSPGVEPTGTSTATGAASPVVVETKVTAAGPTQTPTSPPTLTPSATATRTRTPTPTATRTMAAPSGSPWWDCRYGYRKPITIVSSRVVGDQADFPVLVSLESDGDLASKARANGFDIAFTSSDGTTKLAHEIEAFNEQTGELVAWVKVPTLSSSSDTVIYMYYGNPTAADQQAAQAVWPGYEAVWHLSESGDSGTYLANSAVDDHHGMTLGTYYNLSGKIGGSRGFGGTDQHMMTVGNDAALFTGWSRWAFDFWIYPDYKSDGSWASSGEDFFLYGNGPVRLGRVRREGWEPTGQGTLQIDVQFAKADTVFIWRQINRQVWNHIAYTYDGTDLKLIFNGSEVARESVPGDSLSAPGFLYFGHDYEALNGSLDEVRISTRERSDGWVLTEYNNQGSPGSFIRLGSEVAGQTCSP